MSSEKVTDVEQRPLVRLQIKHIADLLVIELFCLEDSFFLAPTPSLVFDELVVGAFTVVVVVFVSLVAVAKLESVLAGFVVGVKIVVLRDVVVCSVAVWTTLVVVVDIFWHVKSNFPFASKMNVKLDDSFKSVSGSHMTLRQP